MYSTSGKGKARELKSIKEKKKVVISHSSEEKKNIEQNTERRQSLLTNGTRDLFSSLCFYTVHKLTSTYIGCTYTYMSRCMYLPFTLLRKTYLRSKSIFFPFHHSLTLLSPYAFFTKVFHYWVFTFLSLSLF